MLFCYYFLFIGGKERNSHARINGISQQRRFYTGVGHSDAANENGARCAQQQGVPGTTGQVGAHMLMKLTTLYELEDLHCLSNHCIIYEKMCCFAGKMTWPKASSNGRAGTPRETAGTRPRETFIFSDSAFDSGKGP